MSPAIESRTISNPFPGLRPFETDEYRLFFGREGQASALITRLERSHFLAIVGTSGSGKSSLVRAGLLPALRGGLMAGAGSGWRIAIMRPGSDPIGNLATALADKNVLSEAGGGLAPAEAEAVIEATLRRGSLGLVDAARQARLGEHEKLLVVVDQFEELFRFRAARPASSTGDDASAFVKLLLEAAQQRELQIYIVPTMRSDFLGDCAQFQGLPEAINDGQYLIPRMTRDERRFAITGPVGVTRGKISEPLVNRLMNDVGDNPDQLPILQHALMRTWDYWSAHRRNGEPINLEHYEAVGTMTDALSLHADEAFNELPDERSRLIAQKLFKALTEQGTDNRETRRPLPLHQLCNIAEASEAETVAVIDTFRREGRSFLMPQAGTPLEPDTIIDISHESLIRNWERLKAWVQEEAQSARIYRRLAESALLYSRGEEGLLAGPFLEITKEWRKKQRPNRVWAYRYNPEFETAVRFLDSSVEADNQKRAAQEQERLEQIERERRELEQAQLYAEQQRRAARRLRYLSLGMAVMFLLALATAVAAFSARRQARASEHVALALRDEAVKQQSLISSLLEREKGEKQKARDAEELAEKQARIADDERKKADKARLEAVAALSQAQEQTKIAQAEKTKADAQRVRAEEEVKKNNRAREANDNFRDAVADAQRGDYGNAGMLLKEAIEGYEDPLVDNKEAVADSEMQHGNFLFSNAYAQFIQRNGDLDERTLDNVKSFSKNYDRAAKIYEAAPVSSSQKAAAALFTLGTMLLKFTKDAPAGRAGDRAALAELIALSSLDRSLPKLGFFSGRQGGKIAQQSDESRKRKAEVEVGSMEHYEKALDYYRKAGDSEGQAKTAFQLGDYYMKKANFIAAGNEFEHVSLIYPYRQKAIHYFEQLVSPSTQVPDSERVRLLVWLGGLYQQVGNQQTAESYFGRAIAAFRENAPWDRAGFGSIAEIAEEAGQKDVAAVYYAKALAAYQAENNLPLQAKMLYSLGRVYEQFNLQDSGAFDKAMQYYRQAVKTSMQAMANNPDATGDLDELLRIGELGESTGDFQLALDAYRFAITSVGTSQVDWRRLRAARAQSELGSVFAELNDPERAMESYQRSLNIYKSLVTDSDAETSNAAKREMQLVRKTITALLQTMPAK